MNRTKNQAEAFGRTGKLSAQGEAAVKNRLQRRFDSGLITQKSRSERLDAILEKRKKAIESGKAAATSEETVSRITKRANIPADDILMTGVRYKPDGTMQIDRGRYQSAITDEITQTQFGIRNNQNSRIQMKTALRDVPGTAPMYGEMRKHWESQIENIPFENLASRAKVQTLEDLKRRFAENLTPKTQQAEKAAVLGATAKTLAQGGEFAAQGGKLAAKMPETQKKGWKDLTENDRKVFENSFVGRMRGYAEDSRRISQTAGKRYASETILAKNKGGTPDADSIRKFKAYADENNYDFRGILKDSGYLANLREYRDTRNWMLLPNRSSDIDQMRMKSSDNVRLLVGKVRSANPKPTEPSKPAFALKSDSKPAGMTSKNQGSFFQSETDIEKAVRLENAAKPKPLAGQKDMFDSTAVRLAPTTMAPRALTPVKSPTLKSTVAAVKGKQLARAAAGSGVATLRTATIQADPERFQYKMNTAGPVGVTDQFKETKVWNKELAGVVQVWKDPANGQTYVVNGHHRFELAQRLGVKKLNVQYIAAKDAAEARAKGAMTNIAEGRGTSVDAAKWIREQGDVENVVKTMQSRGISLSERVAGEGLALAKTAPKIWRDVIDEMTPVSRAVAIGKAGLRHEDQLGVYRKATEGNWRSGKVEEFATELKRAPLVKTSSGSLFGDDEFVNTAEHRAAIADRFKTQLKSGKKLFGTVARGKNAGRLEAAGNQIDRQASAAIADQNDKALMSFEIERKFGSRTSRLLDRYSVQLANGDKLDRVYPGFEGRALRALQKDIEKPLEPRLAKRRARLAAMTPAEKQRAIEISMRKGR